MPRPTGRQRRAKEPSIQKEGLQHAVRRRDRLQQTAKPSGRSSGVKTVKPPADAALQVAEDDERRGCEARYPPDMEKFELAVGRQQ